MILEWLKALLWGVIEGVTEWLPVSSTGHLILFEEAIPFAFSHDEALLAEFSEMLEVVIQLGAILAVILLFWHRLFPFSKGKDGSEIKSVCSLWIRLAIASVPAALIGTVGDWLLRRMTGKDIDAWLYHSLVVAAMLILYGVAFLLAERFQRGRVPKINVAEGVSCRMAFAIGCFQALSLLPGTSRSGATILGGTMLGLSRTAAAEFSFFLAVPAMLGASLIKVGGFVDYLMESRVCVPLDAWIVLAVGFVTAFAVSLVAIRFLTDFVKKHSFAPFGVYRIALGALVIVNWCIRKG